jgi:4-hydroxyphenylpyruvate dioxygenase
VRQDAARRFQADHGLGVRAVALRVADAAAAHAAACARGAVSVLPPHRLGDPAAPTTLAEVQLYGDVVLRFVSRPDAAPAAAAAAAAPAAKAPAGASAAPSPPPPPPPFLPGYADCTAEHAPRCYGLRRLDHAVGNVPVLADALRRIAAFTGFHEFAEFVAADVGTLDSGLNSVVLASNDETVLLPLNEPTHGTRRKSQIQTFLEQHGGPGVQHLALKTDDIFATLRAMRDATSLGGFEFLRAAREEYYATLPERIGADALTPAQLAACAELGILADRDDQGLLLQIFTKPLGDRPTLFLEIIQRVGCRLGDPPAGGAARPALPGADAGAYAQAGGCGGFGKGNFTELFRSIEDYERTLKA